MLPHPTPVIESELKRRAELIRREPWIAMNGHVTLSTLYASKEACAKAAAEAAGVRNP